MNGLTAFWWREPAMRRKMKFQLEADPLWAQELSARPGCEELFSCLQCGTCSATCPLSIYMDFGPRRVIALVREGFRDDALGCQTIWLCASCYSCAVHCPRQIRITDVMYNLKREALRRKLHPRCAKAAAPAWPRVLPVRFVNTCLKTIRSSKRSREF